MVVCNHHSIPSEITTSYAKVDPKHKTTRQNNNRNNSTTQTKNKQKPQTKPKNNNTNNKNNPTQQKKEAKQTPTPTTQITQQIHQIHERWVPVKHLHVKRAWHINLSTSSYCAFGPTLAAT